MRLRRILLVVFILAALAVPMSVGAQGTGATNAQVSGVSCGLPESNAESLVILNNVLPRGYWWDHADLTIAVQAHPSATDAQLDALHGAIATWAEVLDDCFEGLITLTDVTGSIRNPQDADIVVHFVPHFGGAVFGGKANCGAHRCPNVLVSSEAPPAWGIPPYDPQLIEWYALHEIGHALGLGHATNLLESTDLMGYGWILDYPASEPVLSDCDVDALAFVFAWVFDGSEPHPPAEGPYNCSLD